MKPTRFFTLITLLLTGVFILTYNSCSKKEETPTNTVPLLSTKTASTITNSSAIVGGVITGNGGASVIERGVCFSSSSNPSIADNSVQSGSGTGTFDCEITGLNQNTKYYFKAYAMNSVGIGYGEEKSFTTLGGGGGGLPTVNTASVSNITQNSATSGGNVTDQGSSSVTAKGVCWSTSPNPTLSNSHTIDGSGAGSFTSNITGLTANTTYYVKAYATNSSGSAYGNQVNFTTQGGSSPGCQGVTIVNYHGQIYNTIEIGDQCWLKENLNYQTGNSWCYDNDPSNCATYGRLYDWGTIMNGASSSNSVPSGVQGICPSGWHLPSDNEWTILTDFLGGEVVAGDKMKSQNGWSNNGNGNNSSGFTALPGGYRDHNGFFKNLTWTNSLLSTTEYSSTNVWLRFLYSAGGDIGRIHDSKIHGCSVRCLKD